MLQVKWHILCYQWSEIYYVTRLSLSQSLRRLNNVHWAHAGYGMRQFIYQNLRGVHFPLNKLYPSGHSHWLKALHTAPSALHWPSVRHSGIKYWHIVAWSLASIQDFRSECVTKKIIFLFFNENICHGYSKEPSQQDGYFEHTKHIFEMIV